MDRRRLTAAVVAVVLTVATAGAAVILNIGAGSAGGSPAGAPAVRTDTAPPSTLYVDVTVPDLAPGSAPRVDPGDRDDAAGTPAATVPGHPHVEGSGDDD